MDRLSILIKLAFCLLASGCIAQDAQYFYTEAKKALEEKNHEQFYSMITKAYELHPYNQNILWNMGLAAALNNKVEESIQFLNRALNINSMYDLGNPNLNALKSHPEFKQLVNTKAMLSRPVVQSDTAYTLEDRQLHLEAVAFDPVEQTLYGGSIHKRKIIKIDNRGVVSDFTLSEQYDMGGVFGLKVDGKKRMLWASSSAIPEMQHYDSALASSLFQFDVETGKLLNSYIPVDTVSNHIFGDVALDSKGIPYVSDSRNNIIYKYDSESNKLLPYFSSKEFWNIQGLAFSDGDKLLYIADYIKGIFVLDVQMMQLSKINVSYDLSLKGCDGILFYKNSLITIQNGVHPNRVVRHYLNKTGNEFTRYEFIDNAHPAYGEPTIGSLAGTTMYYVANSQWNGYDSWLIKKSADLQPIVILKYVFK